MMRILWQDLRYGARMLLKHKGFTLVAVLSLALGIGANTAMFSVLDAVLLKTLPVDESDRLVLLEWQSGVPFRLSGMSGTSFVPTPPGTKAASFFRYDVVEKMQQAQMRSPNSPLSDLFTFAPLHNLTAVIGDQAEVIEGQAVSGGYFSGLRVRPFVGRAIANEDDKPGAVPVVVLSHQFWQQRFNSNRDVIGQQIKLNKTFFTIIGITPPAFKGTSQVDFHTDVTISLALEPELRGENSRLGSATRPGVWWLNVMGRLKPDATNAQARESLNGVFQAAALEAMPPPRKANQAAQIDPKDYPHLIAESGSRGMLDHRRQFSSAIFGLFIVVALVLLIACANVANLLLARAALRGPEINVRLAVGAGRWRLVRQLLTESVLLAMIGGLVGVIFAVWAKSALIVVAGKDSSLLPSNVELSLNGRVLVFTLAISLLTGVLFGLAPAWRSTSLDLGSSLRQRRNTGAVSRLSKSLIVAQVAVSLLLLVGAGLFIRTLRNLQHVDLGFKQENLLLFRLQPQQAGYKGERLTKFYQDLFARLDHLPGVQAATFEQVPLIASDNSMTSILLPGETEDAAAAEHDVNRQIARENYFAAMEIPLLSGRGFTGQDNDRAPRVAIASQELARKYFPNEEVLGKRVTITDGHREVQIVGIVADAKYMSQREEIKPLLYTPWQQEGENIGTMYFTLRTGSEPTALAATVRQLVRDLDSNLPVTELSSQAARAEETMGQERLTARLFSFFGLLALLLAAIGLSGVLAYSVSQRTNEIGIRMALGAQAANVLRLIIWQGMKLVLLGLALGVSVGYLLIRLLATQRFANGVWQQVADQLYGVKPGDPITLVIIASLLTVIALIACWLPARRAARVDPLVALRYE